MAIRESRPNPWCPDCHAHQMTEVKARVCQDEVTLAFLTQRTWECPACDAPKDDDVGRECARSMGQRQIAQAKARGEWRGNNY